MKNTQPNFTVIDHKQFQSKPSTKISSISYLRICLKIADILEKNYFTFDGFVIVCAIEIMAYLSSMISFICENLGKPVVITSSSATISDVINDAKNNLLTSLIIAGRTSFAEVVVCFNSHVFRGNRITRCNPSSHNSFRSRNYPLIAEFGSQLIINQLFVKNTPPKKPFQIFKNIFYNVFVLYITPMMMSNFLLLKTVLHSTLNKTDGRKGIVLAFFGVGNAPENEILRGILEDAVQKYMCEIAVVSQCAIGHVDISVYASGNFFSNIGLLNGSDMTVEACVAKFAYLMGKGLKGNALKVEFENDLRGELTLPEAIQGRIVDYKSKTGDFFFKDNRNSKNNNDTVQ